MRKIKFSAVMFLILNLSVLTVSANSIFFIKDEEGNITLTNEPSKPGFIKVIGDPAVSEYNFITSYEKTIQKYSKLYGVDISLIKGVMKAESDFRHYVEKADGTKEALISSAGAVGIMQVLPSTGKQMGIDDVYDPHKNIHAGVKYLSFLLKQFSNNLALVLAGYNAGPEAVNKYKGIPPFRETIDYVKKVKEILKGGDGEFQPRDVKQFFDDKGNIKLTNIY